MTSSVLPQKFTHLHAHSDASLKDGLGTVANTVAYLAAHGFEHHALTDHGSLANSVAFTVECLTHGIKPILGVEGYIEVDNVIGHITLLADGDRGFQNIVKLNNLAHKSEGKKPAFTVDQLVAHAADVVLLSGCVASPLNTLPYGDAKKLGAKLKGAFGSRMFAEVMFVSDLDNYTQALRLSEDLNIKVVATNDAHFAKQSDAPFHKTLTQMKAGYEYNSANLFLRTRAEMLTAISAHKPLALATEWLDRAYAIGSKLGMVNLKKEQSLPVLESAEREVKAIVMTVAKKLGKAYVERATYELGIINKMGYAAYFYILNDVVKYARASGVRVGPGRGSGAGSLVLFLLGITTIDPLLYDLPFERFLNPERKGMPDVDTDFDTEGRGKVLEYVKKKWGAIPIATFSRYAHKQLVHDLSKHFRVPRDLDESASDKGPESDEFAKICADFPDFARAYNAIIGQIRHKGKHAGGAIITEHTVPIERTADGTLVAAWTEGLHNELSYAGVVKFDFLGLSALSVLKRLETQFGTTAKSPKEAPEVFEIFKSGQLDGIFQFSGSAGIRNLTMKLAPETFDDLVAINALYRPGALDVGATEKYPEWKKSPRKVPPVIADILAPTYGAIVFQEQVMAIFARMTGGTMGAADEARRVIVKSKETDPEWMKKFSALSETFIAGCLKSGLSPASADKLWHEIAAHSRYSFNKAHSVAYAQVSWEMAWWKYNHPAAFYAAYMNVDQSDVQTMMMSAIRAGVKVEKPDINHSGVEYTSTATKLYMPLSSIKFLSLASAESIVEARKSGGNFKSGADFMKRVKKKLVRGQARAGLMVVGAFGKLPVKAKDLEIDEELDKVIWTTAPHDIEKKYFGMVIITPEELEKIEKFNADGFVAGIVTSIEKKVSTYGPYKVIKLAPTGVFWERGILYDGDIVEGDLVVVKTKADSGKALKIRKL
jgi:DNA polymerase-3 subunit alpha